MKYHYGLVGLARTIIIAGLAITCRLSAAQVTFELVGQVRSIFDPGGLVAPTPIQVGSPVHASIRFDTDTPDFYPDDPTRGTFLSAGWLKVDIGGLKFEHTTGVQVDLLHGGNGDQELFQAFVLENPTDWPAALPTFDYNAIQMAFWETKPPYDLLVSAELPNAIDFSRADHQYAFVRSSTDINQYEIRFTLRQVPEPGILSLLAAGLFSAVLLRRPWSF